MKSTISESLENTTQRQGEVSLAKTNSHTFKALHKILVNELKEIYWAENEIKNGIHKMIRHASAYKLADELNRHLNIFKEHQTMMEDVFVALDEKPKDVRSQPVDVLLKEAEIILDETKKGITRDAGIISSAIKIELYQIAAFNASKFFARTLEEHDAIRLLNNILNQKNECFEKLSQMVDSIELDPEDAEDQVGTL